MTIHSFFNETELTIFYRQTGFSFNDFYKSADGTILAVDYLSRQVFVGENLFRSNVHSLDSLASASLEDGQICLKFKDSSSVAIAVDGEAADALTSELCGLVRNDEQPVPVNGHPTIPVEEQQQSEEEPPLTGKELNETYSRLINSGRKAAFDYLVEKTGMTSKEADQYLEELGENENEEEVENIEDVRISDPDYHRDGTMTPNGIFRVIKKLKPGDRIHLEFKPLIGKLRVYDAEYRKLAINLSNARYFSLQGSDDDFDSLMKDIAWDLFEYIDLYFFCEDIQTEISCHLRRVTVLQILQ